MKKNILLIIIVFIFSSIINAQQKNSIEPKTVKIGFSEDFFKVDKLDAKVAIKMWVDLILKNKSFKVSGDVKIFKTSKNVIESLKNKAADIYIISIFDYLDVIKKIKIVPDLEMTYGSKYSNSFLLVTRKDRNYKSIKELKNKTLNLMYGTYKKMSEIWLTNLFFENKLNYNNFFKKINISTKPAQTILPVFFKQVDACVIFEEALNQVVELNPQIENEIQILAKSPKYQGGIIYIDDRNGKDIKKEIIKEVLTVHNSNAGKQLYRLFKSGKSRKYNKKNFETILKDYKKYLDHKNK